MMAVPNSELREALFNARTVAEILAALAPIEYRRGHPGADCPADAIPAESTLCEWLPNCPEAAAVEAGGRLDDTVREFWPGDDVHRWAVYRPRPGSVVLFDPGTGRLMDAAPALVVVDSETPGFLTLAGIHRLWLMLPEADRPRPRHPLAPIVAAWQEWPREVEPYRIVRRASLARLDRMTEAETARLPGFPNPDAPKPSGQLDLPGFGPVVSGCPSWLLWMFDATGGESMAQGRGAPWPMRLFVGALLHVKVHDRTGRWITMRVPNDDALASDVRPAGIHRWLHPRGWWPSNRRRDWHQFPAALDSMRERLSYVPVKGIGSVAMLFPSVIPRDPSDPFVEFTIRIPSSAAHGARIDWPRLCQYGTESAALYRAYLSAAALLDKSARRGQPITREIHPVVSGPDGKPRRRKGGRILRDTTRTEPNPAAHYVEAVTDRDLARMVGFDSENRRRRHDARKAFERLHADGVIDLVQHRGLWWLYGPKVGV